MTNTTIYNAVALGTTAELFNASPTKTVLQTGTTAIILNAKIVNGDNTNTSQGKTGQSSKVEIRYAISPLALTANTTLPDLLKPIAGRLDRKSVV